ncbi:MAG: T9SS type A sorting domain-containing protein [Bacteroidia bacterium]|nr:T9SS type A sorting domain-containing protein [Bacteroidia bacterium]
MVYTFNVSPLSFEDKSIDDKIDVYYNNNTKKLIVAVGSIENNFDYQVFNITGKLIRDGNFSQGVNTIECSNLQTGLYILDVKDNKTTNRAVKKFMKR